MYPTELSRGHEQTSKPYFPTNARQDANTEQRCRREPRQGLTAASMGLLLYSTTTVSMKLGRVSDLNGNEKSWVGGYSEEDAVKRFVFDSRTPFVCPSASVNWTQLICLQVAPC